MANDLQSVETKNKMGDALKAQVYTKVFSKITVGDIITSCNINRNTFYYHFENMYDLLYWTYEREIQNIVTSFRAANGTIPQALDFILSYIDQNITLCQTAYESLGENELKNMYERDLKDFISIIIDFLCQNFSNPISEDFKTFLTFNFTSMLSNQIAWYIKYNKELDKSRFCDYIQTTLFSSLNATLQEAEKKNL
ncbi:MAG: TetR/AcrR family transcriptional regulator [Treponema sp.]|nr:TetR/AcrR family transcriptional regulator [Treponema sp.]